MGPWLVVQPASAAVPRVVWKPIMGERPALQGGRRLRVDFLQVVGLPAVRTVERFDPRAVRHRVPIVKLEHVEVALLARADDFQRLWHSGCRGETVINAPTF